MLTSACALVCAASAALGQVTTEANVTYQLENNIHGWGLRLDNFGLECDPNGPTQQHYFDFGPGVVITLDSVANQAYINGTISHLGSDQLWTISATLSDPYFTNASDATPWHNAVGNNLYAGAIADLSANGLNHNPDGEGYLKNASYAADRLAFLTGITQMTLQDGQGPPAYVLPGQMDGNITLHDFPQGDGMLPFMLAVGHRIDDTTDQVAGFGWLDARQPGQQHGDDGLVQDYLFRVGELIPPANTPPQLTFTLDGGDGPTAGDIIVNEGTSILYSATGVDADAGDVLTLSIGAQHLGGSTSNAPAPSGGSPISDSMSITHVDDAVGLEATATVTDAGGASATVARNVTVLNVVPTLTVVEMVEAVRSGGGDEPVISLAATDPGQDTVTFFIQPASNGAGDSAGGGIALAGVSGDPSTVIVEATGQTTPGSTRLATATLEPFVGLGSHAFSVTARDEDQPNADSNATALSLQVVGPLTGYEITDYDAHGNLQTRSGLPLDDSVNPGTVHTGETIDVGIASTIFGPDSRTAELVLSNDTPNSDMGELTALSILNTVIDGADAHQFSLWEADGASPFDPDAHDALPPGETLPLLVRFAVDQRVDIKDPRTAQLTIFTDQGAAFGANGAAFVFDLTAVQIPEPNSFVIWLAMAVGGVMLFWLRRK